MPMDFTKITAQSKEDQPIDPVSIFQRLRVTDSSINDLWLAQGDALRSWHENRGEHDISISLNTGAGKTLVGLLIGQSLVNETHSLIVYACSSIQLVEQTEAKAKGYGLPVTTYVKGRFSNDLATSGDAICLTTYQALFNGKSIFSNREIAGIIFDDAHTAEHIIRDHYSLNINKDLFETAYQGLTTEFTDYFHSVGLESTFHEVITGKSNRLLLVPPFEIYKSSSFVLKTLNESTIASDDTTTFAWEHLKDHIDLCAFVISSSCITITPPFIPIRTLPYFKKNINRVYLSATLSAPDVFTRSFGRPPAKQIAPSTTAGECERMIIIPTKLKGGSDEDVSMASDMIGKYKTLILTPTYARGSAWLSVAQPPQRDQVSQAIEKFKHAKGNDKLLLTARYDGVDLPGDMCRVVVIDDLPSGVGHLERFLWEYLGFTSALRTAIASRIVQSFGRISRGMSDHGAVILTGKRLIEWLQVPKNVSALPVFLQKQLKLGFQISALNTIKDGKTAIASCLNREKEWVDTYEGFMRETVLKSADDNAETVTEIALAESEYIEQLWYRDFNSAANKIQKTIKKTGDYSVNLVCWHKLWLGYALERSGDLENSKLLYQQAHSGLRNIPPLKNEKYGDNISSIALQAREAAQEFVIGDGAIVRMPKNFEPDLLYLNGTGSPSQVEESLQKLGLYLGLQSTRPDNEHGTGPDVLWISADKKAYCYDAKTDKKPDSVYRKEDLGQLSDHVQWVKDNTDAREIISAFVGPELPYSTTSNPQKGVKVAELSKFKNIADILRTVYQDTISVSLPLSLQIELHKKFKEKNLLFPELENLIEFIEIRTLGAK